MGKIKARKVATPGTLAPKRGRPLKKKIHKKSQARGKYMERYTVEQLEEAMRLIKSNKMSLRDASKEFDIPMATLSNKMNAKCPNAVGRPTVLRRRRM